MRAWDCVLILKPSLGGKHMGSRGGGDSGRVMEYRKEGSSKGVRWKDPEGQRVSESERKVRDGGSGRSPPLCGQNPGTVE